MQKVTHQRPNVSSIEENVKRCDELIKRVSIHPVREKDLQVCRFANIPVHQHKETVEGISKGS